MPKRRSTKFGKIDLPLDVRKPKDIKGFRDLVISGPLTLVLVYADWCPHCINFKNKVWNRVSNEAATGRNINMASVHYDMMDQTPLKNAKIEGYPSLLLVGTDEKPATFAGQEPAAANAMPTQPSTSEELEAMLATPLSGTVTNANAVATEVLNNVNANAATANANINSNNNNSNANGVTVLPAETIPVATATATANRVNNLGTPRTNMGTARIAQTGNSYVPSTEMPPDAVTDIVTARTGMPTMRGGSLLESLYAITKEGAHAGLLLASSAAFSRRLRKSRTRKTKKGKSKHTRRSH